jgi:hypothetical protein
MLAVIILSTLFVIAILALVFGFVRQYRLYAAAHAPPPPAAAMITLAPGARIVSATTDAGKLVLHVATPGGGEVEIFDLATGKLFLQVRTAPSK